MTTHDSLKSTQNALQESKIHIEKLHEIFSIFHSPSYISDRHSHMVDFIHGPKEEPHVMVLHEENLNLHVFEEIAATHDEDQELVLSEREN